MTEPLERRYKAACINSGESRVPKPGARLHLPLPGRRMSPMTVPLFPACRLGPGRSHIVRSRAIGALSGKSGQGHSHLLKWGRPAAIASRRVQIVNRRDAPIAALLILVAAAREIPSIHLRTIARDRAHRLSRDRRSCARALRSRGRPDR